MKTPVLSFLPLLIFAACMGNPEPIIVIQDPLVLQEITPLPRSVVITRAVEYEPVYATYRIIEVSEVNGVQKYFLVRMGADKTGVSIGVTGDIAEDTAFQKIIGNYKIIEVYSDFFRCEIVELAYRIGANAYMRVQTGEKVKEDSPPPASAS
jgi:hypothetical protein